MRDNKNGINHLRWYRWISCKKGRKWHVLDKHRHACCALFNLGTKERWYTFFSVSCTKHDTYSVFSEIEVFITKKHFIQSTITIFIWVSFWCTLKLEKGPDGRKEKLWYAWMKTLIQKMWSKVFLHVQVKLSMTKETAKGPNMYISVWENQNHSSCL